VNQGFEKIAAYQDIRAMAMRARDFNVAFVGSAVGFLLPFFYALLGANAAVLRQLHVETRNSTFHPEHSKIEKRVRLTTAAIVGITIGLFSNFLQGGKAASPLAIAFAAGYASDKLFEFVNRIVGAIFPSSRSDKVVEETAEKR
jgi:hypothetical protein